MPSITAARYGKDNVRLFKAHRDPKTGVHSITETVVCVLLEGDIETSYTRADNSVVVATDSMKNTVFILAKQHPVTPPELFAATVGAHFVDTYAHIHVANVRIVTTRWARMQVDGRPHPHSFVKEGEEKRTVTARVSRRGGLAINSGIADLTVLKSTGSAFHGFVRDEFTTLPETWDRIMSTDVDASWDWKVFPDLAAVRAAAPRFDAAHEAARAITFKRFADDNSASVQATMYKMSEDILAAVPEVNKVYYSLPNKHYFELDLSWHKGIKNTGKDAEVYVPQSNPNGLIKVEVSRDGHSSKL
ncbi:uricase [Cordyceps fumosorosea ARSEF 2679]|uniref:Uricase n=1 Tax=Cordyceps fumosorosea (strain ARSEF 2679) TaxID=1081104 RepID=A0A167Q3L3_CORFA|nr:uricase [Cordyceps fumosorosea ARSEF 2679]OAA57251.1 uricase [Cordyceps fumosorosea ARSEF 2679]